MHGERDQWYIIHFILKLIDWCSKWFTTIFCFFFFISIFIRSFDSCTCWQLLFNAFDLKAKHQQQQRKTDKFVNGFEIDFISVNEHLQCPGTNDKTSFVTEVAVFELRICNALWVQRAIYGIRVFKNKTEKNCRRNYSGIWRMSMIMENSKS